MEVIIASASVWALEYIGPSRASPESFCGETEDDYNTEVGFNTEDNRDTEVIFAPPRDPTRIGTAPRRALFTVLNTVITTIWDVWTILACLLFLGDIVGTT